jgi:hypothetical protein
MKSKTLIAFLLATAALIGTTLATPAPITYETTTGFVITDPTYPFNFPTGKMIGPLMTVYNVKAYPYLAKGGRRYG